jgi:hypothetical protein
MGRVNRRDAIEKFKLRGRYELGMDKNGNPWAFQFGRPLPPYGNPNREHMMNVRETATIANIPPLVMRGECGECQQFEKCAAEIRRRPSNAACAFEPSQFVRATRKTNPA